MGFESILPTESSNSGLSSLSSSASSSPDFQTLPLSALDVDQDEGSFKGTEKHNETERDLTGHAQHENENDSISPSTHRSRIHGEGTMTMSLGASSSSSSGSTPRFGKSTISRADSDVYTTDNDNGVTTSLFATEATPSVSVPPSLWTSQAPSSVAHSHSPSSQGSSISGLSSGSASSNTSFGLADLRDIAAGLRTQWRTPALVQDNFSSRMSRSSDGGSGSGSLTASVVSTETATTTNYPRFSAAEKGKGKEAALGDSRRGTNQAEKKDDARDDVNDEARRRKDSGDEKPKLKSIMKKRRYRRVPVDDDTRTRHGVIQEEGISRDFLLLVALCIGLACAGILVIRPAVNNALCGTDADDGGLFFEDGFGLDLFDD